MAKPSLVIATDATITLCVTTCPAVMSCHRQVFRRTRVVGCSRWGSTVIQDLMTSSVVLSLVMSWTRLPDDGRSRPVVHFANRLQQSKKGDCNIHKNAPGLLSTLPTDCNSQKKEIATFTKRKNSFPSHNCSYS